MFKGSMTALVTPFVNGEIDKQSLKKLISFQINNGTTALVPCGTTGEAPVLSETEFKQVLDTVVIENNGRVPIIAGCGTNSTSNSITKGKIAAKAGVDAVLVVTPYYNRPTQDGLIEHYRRIAGEIGIPVIMYNVPSRTGVDLLPETVAKLAEEELIIGLKEASGSMKRASEILNLVSSDFILLSGDDFTALPMIFLGGKGVISVVSNVVPKKMSMMISAALNNDIETAKKVHYSIYHLMSALFIETNPIPVKMALKQIGIGNGELRLPLVSMNESNTKKLINVMKQLNLL